MLSHFTWKELPQLTHLFRWDRKRKARHQTLIKAPKLFTASILAQQVSSVSGLVWIHSWLWKWSQSGLGRTFRDVFLEWIQHVVISVICKASELAWFLEEEVQPPLSSLNTSQSSCLSWVASILPGQQNPAFFSYSLKRLWSFRLALQTVVKAGSLVALKGGGEGVKISWQSTLATCRASACLSLWCQPAATAGERGQEEVWWSTGSYSRLCLCGITPGSESADSLVKLGHLPTCSWVNMLLAFNVKFEVRQID